MKKKITADKIAYALEGFLDNDYKMFINHLKDLTKEKIVIDKQKSKEIMALFMFAICQATIRTLGDTSVTKYIMGKFQADIFNHAFEDSKERESFKNLFQERVNEYSEVFYAENKSLDVQIGQIFCRHFWGKDDIKQAPMMMAVGYFFLTTMLETSNFLKEILTSYEIIL